MAAAKKKESPPEEEDEDAKGGAEGEGAEGGEGVDLPKKKISGKKMALILAAVLLLVGGGLGAAWFMGYFSPAPPPEEHAEAAPDPNAPPVYYQMDNMLVNLSTTGRRPMYAKVRVQLVLEKEDDRPKVTENMPRIVDSFQTYLRELTPEELQGSAGLLRLREELLLRVNAAVAPVVVKDLLFQELMPGVQ